MFAKTSLLSLCLLAANAAASPQGGDISLPFFTPGVSQTLGPTVTSPPIIRVSDSSVSLPTGTSVSSSLFSITSEAPTETLPSFSDTVITDIPTTTPTLSGIVTSPVTSIPTQLSSPSLPATLSSQGGAALPTAGAKEMLGLVAGIAAGVILL